MRCETGDVRQGSGDVRKESGDVRKESGDRRWSLTTWTLHEHSVGVAVDTDMTMTTQKRPVQYRGCSSSIWDVVAQWIECQTAVLLFWVRSQPGSNPASPILETISCEEKQGCPKPATDVEAQGGAPAGLGIRSFAYRSFAHFAQIK